MDKELQTKTKSLVAKHVHKQAHQRLQSSINCLQNSVIRMEGILEQLDSAADDAERARALNAAIHYLVAGIQSNLRIDLLAVSQAELAKLGA